MIKVRDNTAPMNPMIQRGGYRNAVDVYTTPSPGWRGIHRLIDSPFTLGKFEPGIFRVNPVTLELKQCSCKEGRYSYTGSGPYKDYSFNWYGQPLTIGLPWTSMVFPEFPSALGPWSHTKALAKLNDTKFDVLTFIGELRETIWMMRQPLAAFQRYWENPKTIDLIRSLVQKRYRSPRVSRRLKAARASRQIDKFTGPIDVASGVWLQFRYGIMPLIYDLEGIIEMIKDKFDQDSSVLRAKRAGKRSTFQSETYGSAWYSNLCVPYKVTTKTSFSATTAVYYKLALMSESIRRIRDLGFRTEHIPAVMWEITRLSFVADWFVNVGDFLQAIEPNPSVSILGGCTSEKTTIIRTVRPCGAPWVFATSQLATTLMTPEVSFIGRRLVRKTPITLPASPVFHVSTLSIKRAVDALSLLWMGASSKLQKAQKQAMK